MDAYDASKALQAISVPVRLVGVDRVPATPMKRPAGVARPVLTEMQSRLFEHATTPKLLMPALERPSSMKKMVSMMIAGVRIFCFGAASVPGLRVAARASRGAHQEGTGERFGWHYRD